MNFDWKILNRIIKRTDDITEKELRLEDWESFKKRFVSKKSTIKKKLEEK